MENLIDLIIYSLEDGENIDKFSAEHITRFSMGKDFLVVESTQRRNQSRYIREKVGFCFQAR